MEERNRDKGLKNDIAFIVTGLIISLLFVVVFSKVTTGISAGMTYDATLSVKKNMLKENVENMCSYLDYSREEYLLAHPGASDQETEDAMAALARKKIYSETHMDGCYMWIQKVLNYEGGDNYAIRLIHPNLSDTEGDYLTTNEVNSQGRKAYEEELEGINKDGEIFLTYEFKKLDSDEVTGKVCYSKLYKDFDWIICMGVNFDELDHYEIQARENMRVYQIVMIFAIAGTWLLLIGLLSYGYKRSAISVYKSRNRELEDRLDRDVVTGAGSRDYGEELLKKEVKDAGKGRKDTLLAMIDVDYFKQFNDTYGHHLGDKVLKAVVDAVKECVGENDQVIRWGGDEFIAIIHDITYEKLASTGKSLVEGIRAISLPELTDGKKITSSIGLSFFSDKDEDEKDVLNRADDALYIAKANGRDNWQIV